MKAAGRVIAAVGVAGLTHRRVADEAGVPLGSTTYYFKDLTELIGAAMTDAAQESLERLKAWEDVASGEPDLPDALASFMIRFLAERDRYRTMNELYMSASYRPELRELASLWPDGLTAILSPRIGALRAKAVAVFADGVLTNTMINDHPTEPAVLKAAFHALINMPSVDDLPTGEEK